MGSVGKSTGIGEVEDNNIKKAPGHHLIKNTVSSGHFLPQRLQGITSSTSWMGSRLGNPRKISKFVVSNVA